MRIAILMACHNRVASTTQSVHALKAQTVRGVAVDLFLVDDGSTDGTTRAVREIMPQATILHGDGNLFWCGGVRWAFDQAIAKDYDFYFWLNDDTTLDPDALARMVDTYRAVSTNACGANIIVGSTRDPKTGLFTYGGWIRYRKATGLISWKQTPPHIEKPIVCDTMNGNCVLIAKSVVKRVGNIDEAFIHSMGDLDYGLRATRSGCRIYIAPGYCGTCAGHDPTDVGGNVNASLATRWKHLLGPKGFPVKAWRVFTYRHKGPLWFLAWLKPYVLFWIKPISILPKDS